MPSSQFRLRTVLTAGTAVLALAGPAVADEQHFPLQSYRVGPYAAGGTGFFGGFIDYLNLINTRDGGVNGVKLTWSEGETQYEVERGVEVYERLKSRPGIAAWNPLSVGIAYAMIDRITKDKVPLVTINHGRTDSTDGRVFPYVFPLLLNPYSETSGIVEYLGSREGGLDKLKGKTIAVLYHGSPYGKETIPIYELLAKTYGFKVEQIEVAHPGNEQQSQWLTIRRLKPDYVVLRGWGVMNPVALKTAQKTGFPANRIVGNVWSNSEEDVIPAGEAAKGYVAITTQASGAQYPVLQDIIKTAYEARNGNNTGNLADKKRIGSVYHNLGIVNGILNVEAVRAAQEKFGKRTLTGDEVRWGFEHLRLDESRVAALGAKGLFHSINVTCANHEGDGRVTFQQWDGGKWTVVSDWIAPDWATLRPIIEASAATYAKDHGITPRNCAAEENASHAAAATPVSGRPLLHVEALEARYGGAVRALSGVDLTVAQGEIIALVGSNGAGKTTVLKAVSNLLPAERGQVTAGRILYDGRDVSRTPTDALVRAGLVGVLEGRHCFRALSVEENLVTGGLGRGSGRAAIRDDLERVYAIFPRLVQKRRARAGLISGGEQQMVAIGRALMGRPRLLVLDEPSMGLAPQVVAEIFRTLARLNREEGLTILVAEQNVTIALRHAHHAVVLENGRSVLTGTAADLRARDDVKAFYLGLGGAPA